MLLFFGCVALLIIGYFTYGAFVEKVFQPDPNKQTPCFTREDGVDFMPMPTWKVFFIQLLDIAGLGPILGPIMGALYGPVALIWIVVGCIFAGAVHDYFSGMLSIRAGGESIPEVVGDNLGNGARFIMRVFSIILLVLVGVVFFLGPAKLLANLTGLNVQLLIGCIFVYYFIATILPIDKIIGLLYPVFGALLLFMTIGVVGGLIFHGYDILPNTDFATNTHPKDAPIWPLIFITISCGALSGFHSTQSPLMARCLQNESKGRLIFYGAMIAEGIIGLIWATAGMSFYADANALNDAITAGTANGVVDEVCRTLLGPFGGVLAILGVVILPITSGDTAFRSSRLILAESFKIDQSKWQKRLLIAVPMFLIAFGISKAPFQKIWIYFGWSNQTLATLVLWSAAIYLIKKGRFHWICTLPATFMTAVITAFILQKDIGFSLPAQTSNIAGIIIAIAAFIAFMLLAKQKK